MEKMFLFLFLLFPSVVIAEDTMGILKECDPNPVFRDNVASLANYSGTLPNTSEWADCKASYLLKVARLTKKAELWAETERRVWRYLPGINLISEYHRWRSISPAARNADATYQAAIDHYTPWETSRDTIDGFSGLNSLNAFDCITVLP